MAFTGEFRHTIDAKGRLIVPSRLREELADDLVVLTRWPDPCIALWSSQGWSDMVRRLREQNLSDSAARAVVRAIAASAHQDAVDRQGRINVPQHLRDLAGITREVVVVGALDRGELWSPQRWEEQQEKVEQGRLDDLVQGLDF